MDTQTLLSIGSGGFGVVGSLVLAFSLNPPLLTLRSHAQATELTAQAQVGGRVVPVFEGFDKQQHQRSFASGSRRMKLGCFLLMVGFALQLMSALFPK